jgi:hypothetical protein
MTELTKEYQAAIEAHDAAIRIYHVARDQYRNMELEDNAFLAAKAAYDAATKVYDKAYLLMAPYS